MNIAFVTTFKVSPEKGGTERTTLRISGAFRKGGNRCYNLYAKEIDKKLPPAEFDGVFNIYQINLKDFSKTYNIDISFSKEPLSSWGWSEMHWEKTERAN
ncbi:hypothetical protein DWX90_03525 [Segatella copri]|uniref:Uncharacterized protein n=1 Tax=Segatella copri TaxID=165179 RepID=A0AA92TN31_9BACT|nr:hypothetical protein DWX90_03525 [Segatella copri]